MRETEYFGNDETLIKSSEVGGKTSPAANPSRTTVLPRVEWKGEVPNVVSPVRHRFEELSRLGQGGMGEVMLAQDHDIERTVAVKRLPADSSLDLVLRFVEEIRTVGQLDHPNIVPVHDVGIDDAGRYFFVMKHLRGQTLEGVIEKLKAGDPTTHEAFPFEVRMQIFLGVLNAVDCAHRQGFVHRDLKPANIMVGPFGEVTVMDWGLAKQVKGPPVSPSPSPRLEPAEPPTPREASGLQTMAGMVMGTPLYMSPEQALGANETIDARSDVYSLTVLFHELLYLTHYLDGRQSLAEILEGVKTVIPSTQGLDKAKVQTYVPAELGWFVNKGFQKEPTARWASAREMIVELQRIIQGRLRVQCTRTMAKRMLYETAGVVDSYPKTVIVGGTLVVCLLLMGAVNSVLSVL